AGLAIDSFIPFILKIIQIIESIAFYTGALVSFILLIKALILKLLKKDKEKEIQGDKINNSTEMKNSDVDSSF
ncbi:MAG: hypothetical protein OEY49_19555, partial [Candidatus Heimdallarchaeota archaeon]|nr:hypothetical protein [Candidatus Heimdallarchaeota archaeon]